MLVSYVNSKGVSSFADYCSYGIISIISQAQLRMIIDLTKTRRFYDRNEVEKSGIIYAKLECQGYREDTTKKIKTI